VEVHYWSFHCLGGTEEAPGEWYPSRKKFKSYRSVVRWQAMGSRPSKRYFHVLRHVKKLVPKDRLEEASFQVSVQKVLLHQLGKVDFTWIWINWWIQGTTRRLHEQKWQRLLITGQAGVKESIRTIKRHPRSSNTHAEVIQPEKLPINQRRPAYAGPFFVTILLKSLSYKSWRCAFSRSLGLLGSIFLYN